MVNSINMKMSSRSNSPAVLEWEDASSHSSGVGPDDVSSSDTLDDSLPLLSRRPSPLDTSFAVVRTRRRSSVGSGWSWSKRWAMPLMITALACVLVLYTVVKPGKMRAAPQRAAASRDAVVFAAVRGAVGPCRQRHLKALLREMAPLGRDVVLLHDRAHAPPAALLATLGSTLRVAPTTAVLRRSPSVAFVQYVVASSYEHVWFIDPDSAVGEACAVGWGALLRENEEAAGRASVDLIAGSEEPAAQRFYRVSHRLAKAASLGVASASSTVPDPSHGLLGVLCASGATKWPCSQRPLVHRCLLTECWGENANGARAAASAQGR